MPSHIDSSTSRRTFLKEMGAAIPVLLGLRLPRVPHSETPTTPETAADRLATWKPNQQDILEWRYAAGNIKDTNQDFGFIISLSDNRIPGSQEHTLKVQHHDNLHPELSQTSASYSGQLQYDTGTNTYIFTRQDQELARWQFDTATDSYNLTVTAPELSLDSLILSPIGPQIAEGGTGQISAGHIDRIELESDYHATWASIVDKDKKPVGISRIDCQGLNPRFDSTPPPHPDQITPDYDHNWFALAATTFDGPSFLSCWRIKDPAYSDKWGITLARFTPTGWVSQSFTENDNLAFPLSIEIVSTQSAPAPAPAAELAGQKWRISAGRNSAGDLIDVEVEVPPGQFLPPGSSKTSLAKTQWVEEATGEKVMGTINGQPVTQTSLLVAESSDERYKSFLPAILK